ncbi:MAG: hypothetical protein AB8B80_11430 [Marinicellaceae bacterium]
MKIIESDGAYVFKTPLNEKDSYSIVIDLESINPIQPCVLINETGTISANDVTDVDVDCDIGSDLIYRISFEL